MGEETTDVEHTALEDIPGGAMLTRQEVARFMRVKVQTLNNWLADPEHPFPRGVPLGRGARPKRVWFARDVRAYLEGNNGRQKAIERQQSVA